MKIDEPEAMKQIRAIRNRMREETQEMIPQEIMRYIRARAEEHREANRIVASKIKAAGNKN